MYSLTENCSLESICVVFWKKDNTVYRLWFTAYSLQNFTPESYTFLYNLIQSYTILYNLIQSYTMVPVSK